MSLSQTISYQTAANFTYDSTLVSFSGSQVTLKDQRPSSATFYANYNTDINGTWGNGTLTGTAFNGAVASNGYLDCTGGSAAKGVSYPYVGNVDTALQTGTIIVRGFTPNYSGTPSTNQALFDIGNGGFNEILLFHSTTGTLQLTINSSSNSAIVNANLGAWSPTLGQAYEFCLCFDITSGATRLFIDGIQFGLTQTGVGTRSSTAGVFMVGNVQSHNINNNFKINSFAVYNTVLHTANFTAGSDSIPDTIYSTANPTVLVNSGTDMSGLSAFTEVSSVSGSDLIKYCLLLGSQAKYWNGSAWVNSDGTYAQSNTASEINTNAATLDLTAGYTVKVKAFLHSATGNVPLPTLTSVSFSYNFFISTPAGPNQCLVYGWLTDISGAAISGATITAYIQNPYLLTSGFLVTKSQVTTTTNSAGYWQLMINETTTPGVQVTFVFTFSDGATGQLVKTYTATVPSSLTSPFSSLSPVAA